MISSFSVDKPFPIYEIDAWWSDNWDPLSYGRAYDFDRSFFDQFLELRDQVPRLTLQQQKPMENCDYCNCVGKDKNCYLIFSGNRNEDCQYASWINDCRDCVDNLNIESSELLYECVGCRESYALRYCRDCHNCKESVFLRQCQGCTNCFGCSNQINKQYMVFNEQKTKEEYEQFLAGVQTGSYNEMQQAQDRIDDLLADLIVKEYHGTNVEHCVGDYLRNSRNCHLSFDSDYCEDVHYSMCLNYVNNSMDYSYWGMHAERMYECQACGFDMNHLRFCNLCWQGCSDLTYCDQCTGCHNCFGCVSLKKKSYCILNVQYSKEEYEELVPRIIAHMRSAGEFGEFFPQEHSIYAYNESLAQEHQRLSKEEVLGRGWLWHAEEEEGDQYMGPSVALSDQINDVSDDILEQILTCEKSGRKFKLNKQELTFYREQQIPIPRLHPDERHKRRLAFRNPRKMWERKCEKCEMLISTTYEPGRPEKVLCEECYLEEVY